MSVLEARAEWARLRQVAITAAVLADDILHDLDEARPTRGEIFAMSGDATDRYLRFTAAATRLNQLARSAPGPVT